MIKFKIICINADDTILYIDIHETSKIGTLVRKISELLKNSEIDIFHSELIYNSIKLEHQRMISSYIDFQYRKKEIYDLEFIIYKKHKNIIYSNNNTIKSEPITIPIASISLPHNTDILTTHLKNVTNDQTNRNMSLSLSLEERLLKIEEKQDILINLLKELLKNY